MSATVTRPASSAPAEQAAPARARLVQRLFEPVDIASLVFFRIAFGALMLVGGRTATSTTAGSGATGSSPSFYFTFHGFDWVQPVGRATACTCTSARSECSPFASRAGSRYRVCAALFFARVHLRVPARQGELPQPLLPDRADQLSLLDLRPRAPRASRSTRACVPSCVRSTVPAWALWLAALPDRHRRTSSAGSPSSTATGCAASRCACGSLDAHWTSRSSALFFDAAAAPYLFSYGGLLLDLFAVPLLLWRRTRPFAFARRSSAFHLTEHAAVPHRDLPVPDARGDHHLLRAGLAAAAPGAPGRHAPATAPVQRHRQPARSRGGPCYRARSRLFVAVQRRSCRCATSPIPGEVHWTEEGHRFAWHMKLRDKETDDVVCSR